jgi:hypothetical protein
MPTNTALPIDPLRHVIALKSISFPEKRREEKRREGKETLRQLINEDRAEIHVSKIAYSRR